MPGRLEPTDIRVGAGQKILITGPNGAGKSTLLSVLAGPLGPGPRAKVARATAWIGYLQQELELPPRPAVRLGRLSPRALRGSIDEHAEALLRLGLFRTVPTLDVPVGGLSAGHQRRLALARLLLGGYGTMLVDEPTNHLGACPGGTAGSGPCGLRRDAGHGQPLTARSGNGSDQVCLVRGNWELNRLNNLAPLRHVRDGALA